MSDARGLSSRQAQERRAQYGANAVPAEKRHPLRDLAARVWGPVPWLLEFTLVLTLFTARYADSIAVAFLLLFNAAIATIQEGRARDAIELLRAKITVSARVLRDGTWQTAPAEELVPGDLVHLAVGAIVPADVSTTRGNIAVDQSLLTGESAPRTVAPGETAYAGSTVVRGDADAVVSAIGTATAFGKTVELFRSARTPGQLERFVVHLVTILTAISLAIVVVVASVALHLAYGIADVAIFSIVILLASVPIALPAAFTLATTLGSLELARRGALVTRLSALEDAASMDILCTDKTGTITENRMAVVACTPFAPFSERDVVTLAAATADEAGRDPIDVAIQQAATDAKIPPLARSALVPFDPTAKRSSAEVSWRGAPATAYKGSPDVLRAASASVPATFDETLRALASQGGRVIAVAVRSGATTALAGLIAIADPPRADAKDLIARVRAMDVEVRLLSGDTASTALHVARAVGIPDAAVHASIYPNDKVAIITGLQHEGHIVGMTGDGINDAPALRVASIGIAVANATDVAKSAAGIILTESGLANIVTAIESSRAIFARMTTYTIMKLVKYLEIVGILSVAFVITHEFLLTPELMVALLVFNDGVTLAIATDNVPRARGRSTWNAAALLRRALLPAVATTLSIALTIAAAWRFFHLDIAQVRSVAFLAIVAMGQFSVYIVRARPGTPFVRPSRMLVAATAIAVAAACAMVLLGILASPLLPAVVASVTGTLAALGALIFLAFSARTAMVNA